VTFTDRVLDWVLRHGKAAGDPGAHDLVLVCDHPALAEPSPAERLGGRTWRIRRVTGELTLRDALLEAGALIAVVPESFRPPMDLVGRAWLNRIVRVRPRDIVAALSKRPCEPVTDEALAKAIEAALPQLQAMEGLWSVGGTVNKREIRNVLLGLQLGSGSRLDRETPDVLLTRWILDGVPDVTAPELLHEALRQEHGRIGEWLAWSASEGSLEALVSAGALAGSKEGANQMPEIPGLSGSSDRHRLRSVVEQAVRAAWAQRSSRCGALLEQAEALAAGLPARLAPHHPLLAGLLERYLVKALEGAAAGTPEDDARLEALSTNLHLAAQRRACPLVRDLSRLARFVLAVPVPSEPTLGGWATLARDHLAWGDLAFRRARRELGDVSASLAPPAMIVLRQYAARRDALNRAFAQWLSVSWPTVAGQVDVRQPFALQHLTRLVLRPLLDRGQRVLLLVLDGCDLASFADLIELAADEHQVAIGLPELNDPDLVHSLRQGNAWRALLAPLPTVTSHARRALFAGDIPASTALDTTEEAAANASNDKRAFRENPTLGATPRTLLLKGDVGELGEAVQAALQGSSRLVAVVLNDIDDALASKETTPMRPWRLESLGAGAATWLKEAVEQGWTVVVTADHGHTPYVARDRKLAGPGSGGRIAAQEIEGTVTLTAGPLPHAPLHLLTGFGSWRGAQRRGWHGGAGLEEVFVPLAFLKKGQVHEECFERPMWWSVLARADEEPQEDRAGSSASAPGASGAAQVELPSDVAEALKHFSEGMKLVRHVITSSPVEVQALCIAMRLSEMEVLGLVQNVVDFLQRRDCGWTITAEGSVLSWSEAASDDSWLQRIPSESDRDVLGYLDRHGSIVERELVGLVGSSRRARSFARRVEELSALAPFHIQVDPLPDGKRYTVRRD